MNVRDATPADVEDVRRVHRASIGGLGPEAYDPEQVEAWSAGCDSVDYTSPIESDETPFVVAEDDGEIVGFGSLSFDPSEKYVSDVDAEVTAVYVHPSVARCGVGTALLQALERRARGADARTVALSSSLNAVPFYEHHGYERVRTFSDEFSSHVSTGTDGDVVEMVKVRVGTPV